MKDEKEKLIEVLEEVLSSKDENRFELCVDKLRTLKYDSIKNKKFEEFNEVFCYDEEVEKFLVKEVNNQELLTIIGTIIIKEDEENGN